MFFKGYSSVNARRFAFGFGKRVYTFYVVLFAPSSVYFDGVCSKIFPIGKFYFLKTKSIPPLEITVNFIHNYLNLHSLRIERQHRFYIFLSFINVSCWIVYDFTIVWTILYCVEFRQSCHVNFKCFQVSCNCRFFSFKIDWHWDFLMVPRLIRICSKILHDQRNEDFFDDFL